MMLPDYRTRQRDYLLEIARAMTQELDLEKLLERILRLSVDILAGQAGLIALQDDATRGIASEPGRLSPSLISVLPSAALAAKIAHRAPEISSKESQ